MLAMRAPHSRDPWVRRFSGYRGQPEIYVDLLHSVRNSDCTGHADSFQDNVIARVTYSAQIAFTASNQLGGDDLSGKVKLKVEPLPTSLSTQIFLHAVRQTSWPRLTQVLSLRST